MGSSGTGEGAKGKAILLKDARGERCEVIENFDFDGGDSTRYGTGTGITATSVF